MSDKYRVLPYRTGVSGRLPEPESLEKGELAINYNSETPFITFKDSDGEIQKVGTLSDTTGNSEHKTMTQKSITETIENIPLGGYIYIEQFDRENFQNALSEALSSIGLKSESAIIDCTFFRGKHTITEGFQINNSVTLIFGDINIEFENTSGSNMFTFNSDNISIQGINRNTDKTQVEGGATIFTMKNPDTSLGGYHIKSRGNKNLEIKNVTLVGLRSTMGHQYGNASYNIDGVGGVYIEKEKPETTEGGNTCNNVRIENVLVAGSKAHGIYIDTPILSSIKNVRLSDCGGHGVFINGGTSVLFENTYVSSSNMSGFCIYGSSYISLNNCVAENGGIGFWIRSSFNVTMMSPGVEATKNHGANPWRNSQPVTGKYGLNLSTLASDGQTQIQIPDVNSDAAGYFRGYGILVSGGKSINIFTPYIKSIAQAAVNAGYPNGADVSEHVKYINIIDDARAVYILNPSFKENAGSTIPSKIRHEIGVDANVVNLELVYNTKQTILTGTLSDTDCVSDKNLRAPIYCASSSSILRNGKELITNYQAKEPQSDLELANKAYVDGKDSAMADRVTKVENYVIPDTRSKVLWVGTSIPMGNGDNNYPKMVADQLGFKLYNNAKGSSFACFYSASEDGTQNWKNLTKWEDYSGEVWKGYSLSASIAEIESKFNRTEYPESLLPDWLLNSFKDHSYERLIIPYIDGTIDNCDTVVIDHGYNDRHTIINEVSWHPGEGETQFAMGSGRDWLLDIQDPLSRTLVGETFFQSKWWADDTSIDKNHYFSAIIYLVKKIWAVNPRIRIIIGNYFATKSNIFGAEYGNDRLGEFVCLANSAIASWLRVECIDIWKKTGIYNRNLPAGNDYQLFCPDNVHPHSDTTGLSNKIIAGIYINELKGTLYI